MLQVVISSRIRSCKILNQDLETSLFVVLALMAALLLGAGTVLQKEEALARPKSEVLRTGLLVALIKRPRWLLGNLADAAGTTLQAVALHLGLLVIVQPLMVSGLLFALPLSAALTHRRIRRRDWWGAGIVTVGLAVFALAADPSPGRESVGWRHWAVALVVILAIVMLLAVIGIRLTGAGRAAAWGMGAGISWGVTAALMKSLTVVLLHKGIVGVLLQWEFYGFLISGVVGILLLNSAFQTGSWVVATATQWVFDPMTAGVIGVFLFEERLHSSAIGLAVSLIGFVVMCIGIVILSSSNLVASDENAVNSARS